MAKQVVASHILVKTESEANSVWYDVTHGKDFCEVAMQKSICPSRKKGGSLGLFGRNQMVKEFEDACFSGKKGQIVGPVKTQFGWHVIKIEDIK